MRGKIKIIKRGNGTHVKRKQKMDTIWAKEGDQQDETKGVGITVDKGE